MKEGHIIDQKVMSALEKEVEDAGTMYFVWRTRIPNDEKGNVDVFFSGDATIEECEQMLAMFTHAVKSQAKDRPKTDKIVQN